MAGDEKADLAWGESMVSQLFVVVEVGDDGLGRTPGIGEHKPTNFFSKAMLATEAGADLVTVEEWATAQQMAAEVAKRLGREVPKVAAPKAERIAEEAQIEGHA